MKYLYLCTHCDNNCILKDNKNLFINLFKNLFTIDIK